MLENDQIQKDQGKTVQVGIDQINNPTPQILKVIFRTVLYLSALWALLAGYFTDIPQNVLHSIDKWLLIGNGIMNMSIKFFGWDFKSN